MLLEQPGSVLQRSQPAALNAICARRAPLPIAQVVQKGHPTFEPAGNLTNVGQARSRRRFFDALPDTELPSSSNEAILIRPFGEVRGMSARILIKTLFKQVAFNTQLYRSLFNVYPLMYSPTELIFLTECITSVSAVPGSFLEVGCAYGATTVFLNKFMKENKIKRNYYAIDTFSGFAKDHVGHEVKQRKKSPTIEQKLRYTFRDNNKLWFDKTMALHDIEDVITLERDASRWDFSGLGPIAFCLIDVDLYIPVKESLANIYYMMSPGGIIIVDDCWNVEEWDGALQAYEEFIKSKGIPREIIGQKLGIIRADY